MSDTPSSGGLNFFGLLFLIFLTLKLCNVIDWSWWWVSAPLWMPFALACAGALIYLLYQSVCSFADWVNDPNDPHP